VALALLPVLPGLLYGRALWLETDRYDPSLPLALKIARLFRRPVESIFSDEPDARSR